MYLITIFQTENGAAISSFNSEYLPLMSDIQLSLETSLDQLSHEKQAIQKQVCIITQAPDLDQNLDLIVVFFFLIP